MTGRALPRPSRRSVLLGAAAALALPLAGCARQGGPDLVLACGEPGGAYLQFGELLDAALHRRTGIELALRTTHGSGENLELLGIGAADLALALVDTADAAATATSGAPDAERGGIVAIGRIYQNYLQCIVRADSDLRTLDDLAGRRISIGAPGSGSSHTTRRLLSANRPGGAVSPPVITELELAVALRSLANGDIDALFWSGGIPTPEITEFSRTVALRLITLDAEVRPLETAYPHEYLATRVPAGVYGAEETTATLGISNLLLAREDLSDDAARALVDTLASEAERLVPRGSVGLQLLTLATLIDTGDVPLHPAARSRYRERYR